jgi:cell wall-associated NlpC family hydrolase
MKIIDHAVAGALVLIIAACGGAPYLTVDDQAAPQVLDYEALLAAPVQPVSDVRQRLAKTAQSYLGAPLKRGGASPEEGFDCTGYVFYVYQEAAGITLPRKSHDQVQMGAAISPINLQPGDLIYFKVEGIRSLHVGLYLGEGRFIHAPSTNGTVEIDSLGTEHWRLRFLGARRILSS